MADDWTVGDLAVCVDAGPCRCGACPGLDTGLEAGKVYEVCGIKLDDLLYLDIPRRPSDVFYHDGSTWIGAQRFRKIRPDEPQACEAEFVELLNLSKRKVRA